MSLYRVDAAPPGRPCDAIPHARPAPPAAVITQDGSLWCPSHWWPIAADLRRDRQCIGYSRDAWTRLGNGTA